MIPDGDALSRHSLHNVLLLEFLHMGQTQLRCGSFHHYGGIALSLVWHIASTRLSRLLLRLSEATLHAPGQN